MTADSTTPTTSMDVLEPLRAAPARHLTDLMEGAAVTGARAVTLREHEFAVQIGLRAVPGEQGEDHELVLVDEPEFRERGGERNPAGEEVLPRFCFEFPHRGLEVAAQEFRVPIDLVQHR